MTSDRLPPLGPDGSNHSSVLELSALIDRALSVREAAAIHAHVEACLGCADQLNRLRHASDTLRGAGRPAAPAGALDGAVVEALRSTGPAAIFQARPVDAEPVAPIPSPSLAPAAELRTSVEPAVRGFPASVPAARPAAGAPGGAPSQPRPRVGQPAPWRPPWLPAALDSESAKDRAISRRRRSRAMLRYAAVAVIVALVATGAVLASRSSPHPTANGGTHATQPTLRQGTRPLTSTPITGTLLKPVLPPPGVFAVEFRERLGPGSCAKFHQEIESFGTVSAVVNPPPHARAIVLVSTPKGEAQRCILVSNAFVEAWKDNISGVTVVPSAGGTPAAAGQMARLEFEMRGTAISDSALLNTVIAHSGLIVALAQGVDIGPVTLERNAGGYAVSIRVTHDVANFVASNLKG
jgi:hypothetical protein